MSYGVGREIDSRILKTEQEKPDNGNTKDDDVGQKQIFACPAAIYINNELDYGECTFEWVYQPDGSTTFPVK